MKLRQFWSRPGPKPETWRQPGPGSDGSPLAFKIGPWAKRPASRSDDAVHAPEDIAQIELILHADVAVGGPAPEAMPKELAR